MKQRDPEERGGHGETGDHCSSPEDKSQEKSIIEPWVESVMKRARSSVLARASVRAIVGFSGPPRIYFLEHKTLNIATLL